MYVYGMSCQPDFADPSILRCDARVVNITDFRDHALLDLARSEILQWLEYKYPAHVLQMVQIVRNYKRREALVVFQMSRHDQEIESDDYFIWE